MKRILIIALVLQAVNSGGQHFSLGIQQDFGISSYTRQLLPYGARFSNSTEIQLGYFLVPGFGIKSGAGYLRAGASSEINYSGSGGATPVDYELDYVQDFIKIPLLLSFTIDKGLLLACDIGYYYALHVNHFTRTDPENEQAALAVNMEDYLGEDDHGLQLHPYIAIPISQRSHLSFGLQFEYGLKQVIGPDRHYKLHAVLGYQHQL